MAKVRRMIYIFVADVWVIVIYRFFAKNGRI